MGQADMADYGPSGNAFNGDIGWVLIDIGDDDHDHLIKPEAMARQ